MIALTWPGSTPSHVAAAGGASTAAHTGGTSPCAGETPECRCRQNPRSCPQSGSCPSGAEGEEPEPDSGASEGALLQISMVTVQADLTFAIIVILGTVGLVLYWGATRLRNLIIRWEL